MRDQLLAKPQPAAGAELDLGAAPRRVAINVFGFRRLLTFLTGLEKGSDLGINLAERRELPGICARLELPRVNRQLLDSDGPLLRRDEEQGAFGQVEIVAIDNCFSAVPVLAHARPLDLAAVLDEQLTSMISLPSAPTHARTPVRNDDEVNSVVPREVPEGVRDPGTVVGQCDRASTCTPVLARDGGTTRQAKTDRETANREAQPK